MLLFAPFLAKSQGFQVSLQGTKQLGMGHTGVALAKDEATVFFNPAGMSMLKGNSVGASFSPIFANTQYVDNATQASSRTENPMGTPFTFYGVFGSQDSSSVLSKFKFGIGVYTPFGSSVNWGENWTGRAALTSIALRSIYVQPTVSYKISDKLSIGVGVAAVYGSVNLQRKLLFPTLAQPTEEAKGELDGNTWSWGYNVGIYYQPVDQLSIGVSYRSQVNVEVDGGTATFTNIPAFFANRFPSGGKTTFKAKLPLPQVFNVGIAYKPMPNLTVSAEANYIGWSAYDSLIFDYADNTLPDTRSARLYKDITTIRVGAEYMLNNLAIRGGAYFGPTAVSAGHLTPETPDADRIGLTFGLGYKVGNLGIDAAFLYITTDKRQDTNSETQLSGTFQTKAIIPSISVSYGF